MASEKQIRANRENAKRSTGPKTAAGRLKSSRNALRHGLTLSVSADPAASIKASLMTKMLVPEGAGALELMAAAEMAQAQVQLQRVASVRSQLLANLDLAAASLKQVRRLAVLDRYEREALARRRAAQKLLSGHTSLTSKV